MTTLSDLRFWLSRSGSAEGPFDLSTFVLLVQEGRVRAKDQVAIDGDQWFAAGMLKFFPAVTTRYHDWLWCLKNNTQSMGAKGTALVLAALPVTLVATLLGLTLFPAGMYPRIVLAAPGLIVAAAFIYLYGFFAFKLPSAVSVVLSVLIALPAAFIAFQLLKALFD